MSILGAIGLQYPAALYLFALVPALIIAYLARERPRQVVVSSVLAFRALRATRGERFGGFPRLNWTFFIELLILSLAVLAMAAPYFVHKGNPVAVVVDNSAAMQVKTPSGKTPFIAMRSGVEKALAANSGSGDITVYVTSPQPHPVADAHSESEALAALRKLEPTDAPDDPAALIALLTQLNANRRLGRIIVGGYRPLALPVPPRFQPIVAGDPVANYAITSFALDRERLGATTLHGRVNVANFSPGVQTLKITVTSDGREAGAAQASVSSGEVAALDFSNLPPGHVYQARLEPADAFALDNTAFATASTGQGMTVLFVSPVPGDGQSLTAVPGIRIEPIAPAAYSPKRLADADLAIFEYTAPKELPSVNSMLIMPPPDDPVFGFAFNSTAQITVTGWPTTDPLTDGVNFRLLNVRAGNYFEQHAWMQPVVSGAGGALILAGEREGHRFVATGFNPLPYLGRRNLPMSILTLNMLNYLAGLGAQNAIFHTGEPWPVPAGITRIVQPSGRALKVQPGATFIDTTAQGIYRLESEAGSSMPRAVNLANPGVSDLQDVPPIKLQGGGGTLPANQSLVTTPLTPYLIAVIIALIVLEGILVYRRRRPLVSAPT